MILGIELMDPTVKGIFFLVAVILFIVSSFIANYIGDRRERVNLVPLGLAFFAFPFMWDAFALA